MLGSLVSSKGPAKQLCTAPAPRIVAGWGDCSGGGGAASTRTLFLGEPISFPEEKGMCSSQCSRTCHLCSLLSLATVNLPCPWSCSCFSLSPSLPRAPKAGRGDGSPSWGVGANTGCPRAAAAWYRLPSWASQHPGDFSKWTFGDAVGHPVSDCLFSPSPQADDQAPGQATGMWPRRGAGHQGACILPLHRLG